MQTSITKGNTMSIYVHERSNLAGQRTGGLLSTLKRVFALRRQRAHLAQLDDHMLADIGITRSQAQEESRAPLWDVPANWRR